MARKSGDDWRRLERHRLSAGYPDLTGQAWEDFKANLREYGLNGRKIVLYEGKVLDGWQLQRACVEVLDRDARPDYRELPKGRDPQQFVWEANEFRRHESEQAMERRVAARRKLVAELEANGDSIREISQKTGAPKRTVERDLKKIRTNQDMPNSGVPRGTPENDTSSTEDTATPSQSRDKTEKVKPADVGDAFEGELLCSRCTRTGKAKDCNACKELNAKAAAKKATRPGPQRNGQAVYDWRAFHDHFGGLVRQVNELGRLYGAKDGPAAGKLRDQLGAFKVAFTDWHTSLTRKQTA